MTNFDQRLAPPHAGLATQILKDPYHFDFLGLGDEAHERDIENALIRHITRFLLELGFGFAFVGRQFRLEVAGDDFFIDLLFYLSAVDAQIKASDDAPTIGLLLVAHRTDWSPSTRYPASTSPLAWPSTNLFER